MNFVRKVKSSRVLGLPGKQATNSSLPSLTVSSKCERMFIA
jgi:hypothetical protein